MSPIVRVDAGWLLTVQEESTPRNLGIRDWAALNWVATAHAFEREHSFPYYEEPSVRAATFLYYALRIEPFHDYNATVGTACAEHYMRLSGQSVEVVDKELFALVGAVRAFEKGLVDVARQLDGWRT